MDSTVSANRDHSRKLTSGTSGDFGSCSWGCGELVMKWELGIFEGAFNGGPQASAPPAAC